ncbi:capping protein inhibiting regulator of actin dynamics isoform X2 [Nematostella vectensis]|uniref:capping protein inhibiting regulator of actin dynamics isoform X2 n=1 Tax=Nematostella vectensis TaxID=45351 RepID=UPI00138FA716|nr:capping protein inhibiting regulator of actin dynamics isoform X2 [Nematostella vectensis]
MAVGRGFFDQYSVFCVFGSVVGCVVVPLITQSVESVIFSAIVISLTATHLTKRASKSDNTTQVYAKELDKRNNRKIKDRDVTNTQPKKKKPSNQILRSSEVRKRRDDELRKLELAKQLEWDRKQEEKKERKQKKKEERMRKKEQEKEEKEREDLKLKRLKEERLRDRYQDKSSLRSDNSKVRGATTGKATSTRKSDHSTYKTSSSFKPPASPVLTLTTLSRQPSVSEDVDSNLPSPPPSVWKVPEYVEPKWNPGKTDLKGSPLNEHKLNNDVVCKKPKLVAPFNQLYNQVRTNLSFNKNQYMNQEKETTVTCAETVPYLVRKDFDKPDNRQTNQDGIYSSFSGLPNLLVQLQQSQGEEEEVKSYSLFGPEQPNSSIFRSPLTGR